MNIQLKNYLELQSKFKRIEDLTNAAWDVHYCYDKMVPTLLKDGFEFETILDYMTVELQMYIDRMEKDNLPLPPATDTKQNGGK